MRLFGILLIIFNLLAGVGFVYLATQDWKGRQTITAAGLRHILLLKGLPLEPPPGAPEGFDTAEDETPFVVEMGGAESTKTISKKLLESYFQANAVAPPTSDATPGGARIALATGAQAVTNQISEVKRVQQLINSELAKDGLSATDKLALLRSLLLYQAENYDLRLEYMALTSPTDANGRPKSEEKLKEDIAKLTAILESRFKAVLDKPQMSDSPILDPAMSDADKLAKSAEWNSSVAKNSSDRRARLAHLLIHLDRDAAWQKRVMAIIGMRRYVQSVSAQLPRFENMITSAERPIPDDQATFVKVETGLREQAIQYAERAKAVAGIRAALTEQKTAQDDAVSRRRTQLEELIAQLNKVKGEVDELLVRQSGIEKQLFEVQREVALTLEEVYRLDKLLTQVERERYGLTPEQPKQ